MKEKLFCQVGENKISVGQTSKGHWFCSEISIYGKDLVDIANMQNAIMELMDFILNERNKNLIIEEKE